jgi:alkyl hydroperoxide reductase subunit AhpC
LREQESKLDELDIRVKIVTFDRDVLARAYARKMQLRWPLLEDRQRVLYQNYGMNRGSWWDIYGLPSIWEYLRLIASGRRPGKPGEDWRQMGGNVLIDPQGIVRLHYVSQTPHDRPSIESILAVVQTHSS